VIFMIDEDIELDDIVEEESSGEDALSLNESSQAIDARRRLEEKLEEARLRKLLNDYDFD